MSSSAPRSLDEITRYLRQVVPTLRKKQIIVGFDGFVDTIVKPVRQTGASGSHEYFKTIDEFGGFIAAHAHKSTSVQYELFERRSGGNAPNFVKALDALSLCPTAIGMFSAENGATDPLFEKLGKNRYSYHAAGTATVLEFEDGKIFLSPVSVPGLGRGEAVFPLIEKVFPEFKDEAARAGLIAFLNWSELPFVEHLWNDIYEFCLSSAAVDKNRVVFFDLCDTAAKSRQEIEALAVTVQKIGERRKTILSLNGNEAQDITKKVFGKTSSAGETVELLRRYFALDELVIHRHDESLVVSAQEEPVHKPCILNKSPAISTGAGDHFNAAYCLASLAELPFAEKLVFANAYAGEYIARGFSPGLD